MDAEYVELLVSHFSILLVIFMLYQRAFVMHVLGVDS
jgi:hypothetical protein